MIITFLINYISSKRNSCKDIKKFKKTLKDSKKF